MRPRFVVPCLVLIILVSMVLPSLFCLAFFCPLFAYPVMPCLALPCLVWSCLYCCSVRARCGLFMGTVLLLHRFGASLDDLGHPTLVGKGTSIPAGFASDAMRFADCADARPSPDEGGSFEAISSIRFEGPPIVTLEKRRPHQKTSQVSIFYMYSVPAATLKAFVLSTERFLDTPSGSAPAHCCKKRRISTVVQSCRRHGREVYSPERCTLPLRTPPQHPAPRRCPKHAGLRVGVSRGTISDSVPTCASGDSPTNRALLGPRCVNSAHSRGSVWCSNKTSIPGSVAHVWVLHVQHSRGHAV